MLGDLGTSARHVPSDPSKTTPSPYDASFQNRLVTNPVDPAFALPLAAGGHLEDHRPALAAAVAVTDADLQLLLARTNGDLTVANLARLAGLATLARGLRLRSADLLALVDLAAIADPLASLDTINATLDVAAAVHAGKLSIGELAYVLTDSPDSPYGLRDDVIVQGLEAIRQSLRSNPSATPQGQAIASVSSTFGLTDEQSATLAGTLTVNGSALLTLLTAAPVYGPGERLGTFSTGEIDEATFPDQFAAYRLLHRVASGRHPPPPDGHHRAGLVAGPRGDAGVLQFGDLTAAGGFARWVAPRELTEFRERPPRARGRQPPRRPRRRTSERRRAHPARRSHRLDHHRPRRLADDSAGPDRGRLPRPGRARPSRRHLRDAPPPGRGRHPAAGLGEPRRRRRLQFTTAQQMRQAAKARYDERRLADRRHAADGRAAGGEARRAHRLAGRAARCATNRRRSPSTASSGPTRSAGTTPTTCSRWVLIDVEMCACQLTSRIKQAIGSMQMFVQRCFLNLEQAFVQVSRDSAADTALARTTGGSGSG